LTSLTLFQSFQFYSKFPYLFYELYANIPLEHYDQLALSQYLYLDHVLMVDRLMDGAVLLEPQIAYWVNSIYQKIILVLNRLFPTDSPFWAYFEKCRYENVQALIVERVQHTYRVAKYGEKGKIFIFSGKSAMAKAGVAALAYLSQQDISEAITLSCEAYHVGLQLMDNLQDWRSDYRDHLYTPLLTQVLLDHNLANGAEDVSRTDVNTIGTLIYKQGYALETLREAMDYFRMGLYLVRDIQCPAWQNEILRMIQGCEEYSAALKEKLNQLPKKRKQETTPFPQTKKKSPRFLASAVPVTITPLLENLPSSWAESFWRATGVIADPSCDGGKGENTITGESDAHFIQAAHEVLEHCMKFVPPSAMLRIYLCDMVQVPPSISFQYEQDWQIVLNRAAFTNSHAGMLQIYKEYLAYEYGRVARLSRMGESRTLLDEMCVKGFGLFISAKISSSLGRSNLLPQKLNWFERNKQYLWQEIQPYLGLPLPVDLGSFLNFDGLEFLLSYDLVNSYCIRMGDEALARGVQASAEDILNKSTAMAVANRIAGATNTRFDL